MWGWEIQICTQILHRYTLGHNGGRIGNGVWGVEWSHDRLRHVPLKAQGRDPIMFEEYYRENGYLFYIHGKSSNSA